MALIKQKTFSNGISGNYWKITELHLKFRNLKGTIALELYKDSSATEPLGINESRKVFFFDIDPVNVMNNTLAAAYLKIMAQASEVKRAAIPEVLAVPEVLDDDGNVITPAIAGHPAVPAIYGDPDLFDAVAG